MISFHGSFELSRQKTPMSKSTFFIGQPIFNQILQLIPRQVISSAVIKHRSDHYSKHFRTYDHLVTMLYAVFNNCQTLREITTGMLASEQKLLHLGISHHPRRSTISDANSRRNVDVFEDIYKGLMARYSQFLPDSRSKKRDSKTYIFDSTSITLFQDVLCASGLAPATGRQKGGIKVHTLMRLDQDVPCFVRFSSAVANDSSFLKQLQLPKGSIILFDRGYYDYTTYNRFTAEKITWVTRRRARSVYEVIDTKIVSEKQQQQGIISDQSILLGNQSDKKSIKVNARLIIFKDPTSGKVFEFLTNNLKLSCTTIPALYKKRWNIELLFKRLKQNYPLKYFLGDNENAIKIQIWCTLIADLLLKVIKKNTTRRWAFSNLAAMVRIHLMTYIDLFAFLRSPEKALLKSLLTKKENQNPTLLFDT
jgi:hypothetical protein